MQALNAASQFEFLPKRRFWQARWIEANVYSINTVWVMFPLKFLDFRRRKVFSYAWLTWCITISEKSKTTQCRKPPIKTITLAWVIHPSSHTVQARWGWVRPDDWVRSCTHTANPKLNISAFSLPRSPQTIGPELVHNNTHTLQITGSKNKTEGLMRLFPHKWGEC